MSYEHYIICGGVSPSLSSECETTSVRFQLYGSDNETKLTLRINDLHRQMYQNVSGRFRDLLDIATYVYAADQVVRRGKKDVETLGSYWRRDLNFFIPVRDLDFWASENVIDCLAETVGFLSDDQYRFNFFKIPKENSFQNLFNFNEEGSIFGFPEEVVMFSGGLDSLGGAIEETVVEKRRVVLVNHRSTQKLDKRYQKLREKLDKKCENNLPTHIRVTVNKKKWMNQEPTQRSRSFLYMALGATIAEMLGKSRIRFYENGVISLNLPICAQVVGSKATRTTHPRVSRGFENLLTLVSDRPFQVENPFRWITKGEVVEKIAKAGCAELITDSISCTHTWEMNNHASHCGYCSQCIDRRIAIISKQLEQHDPLSQYGIDLFTESRSKRDYMNEDKILFANYLERANQVIKIEDEMQFLKVYPEISRALPYMGGDVGRSLQLCFDLYRRHSHEVNSAVDTMLGAHLQAIRQRTIPADALLRIIYESNLPTSDPVILSKTEEMPENIFRRRGGAWQVRYQGKSDFTVLPRKGADYIHQLLSSPNERISATQIVCGAAADYCGHLLSAKQAIDDGLISSGNPLLEALGDISDWEAVRQYRDEVQRLAGELERAKSENNNIEVDEIEEEQHLILQKISEAVGLGGRLNQARDKKRNIRNALRNNINRVIAKISETDSALADHLTSSIAFGNSPEYRSKVPVTWVLSPIIND
ncbi:7-cyano-7-deazaguanine synthase [uncultured Rubinisphaera sp.]|uniref:7-cyano-7-deazaguanine synthase n=1 Tax=uncultured Rubinisphaera sp. TaxID=1678686 RepID=UPI0030D78D82